jgi:hypothetical protein
MPAEVQTPTQSMNSPQVSAVPTEPTQAQRVEPKQEAISPCHKQADYFSNGFAASILSTAALHPLDKALHVMVKHNAQTGAEKRGYINRLNFAHPFHGLFSAILTGIVTKGMYYVAQGEIKDVVNQKVHNKEWSQFLVGFLTGLAVAVPAHPLNAVANRMLVEHRSFIQTFCDMRKAGLKSFTSGYGTSLSCSAVYGTIYELARLNLMAAAHDEDEKSTTINFAANATAAAIAATFASPFRYARQIQLSVPVSTSAPGTFSIWKELWANPMGEENPAHLSVPTKLRIITASRFCIGWSTLLAAVGMAVGQGVFDSKIGAYLVAWSGETGEKVLQKAFEVRPDAEHVHAIAMKPR